MRRILLILAVLTMAVAAMAQHPFSSQIPAVPILPGRGQPEAPVQDLPDSITIGFVTCYPGPEIFELYGHEAVRVSGRMKNKPIDIVFNYGLFDFDSPGFVYRFVKGETDYGTGWNYTVYFLSQYIERGSKVVERVLPLTQAETLAMYDALVADTLPENSTYRYKYFSVNCATKPFDLLNSITGGRFRPSGGKPFTLRDLLRQYNEGYPWYQLGIDLVLGSMLDRPAQASQAAFIPMELDARCFSSLPENVLVQGMGDGNQRGEPTPLPLTPLFVFWAIFTVTALYFLRELIKRHPSAKPSTQRWSKTDKAVCSVWFGLQGLAGLLVWFLTFCSEHEGTSPNINAVWLNPLWLAIPCMIWASRCRRIATYFLIADAIVSGLFLAAIPLLPQYMNPAIIPLLLTTILLSLRHTLLKRR